MTPDRPGRSATSSRTRACALPALALRRQGELGPREGVDELARAVEPQLGADVLARAGVCGGRDGKPRHAGEDLGEPAERAVLGAEVVAPLADAVRLIDGDEREGQTRQPLQHGGLHQAFGREVEQVELARADPPPDVAAHLGIGVGVELLGRHARLLQGRDLIGHQRDQRRDDKAEPGPDQRGDLVAQALAAAGGKDGERAASGQDLADHAGLQAAEVLVAESVAQHVARGIERVLRGGSRVWGIGGHANLMRRRGQSCNRRLARVLPSEEELQRGRLRTAPRSGPSR